MSEITLFDLPSCPKKGRNACWSLNPWKTRLSLNYKGLDYKTVWVEYPDIKDTLSPHVPPNPSGTPYTIPALKLNNTYIMDSLSIATHLEQAHPSPSLHLSSPLLTEVLQLVPKIVESTRPNWSPFVPLNLLSPESADYFERTRAERLGKSLKEFHEQEGGEEAWMRALPPLRELGEVLGREEGPFFMGQVVSYADFVVVGWLKCLERIDEGLYRRVVQMEPKLGTLYEACKGWLERDDH